MTRKFSEDLYLTNETGRKLYHTVAKNMPIIDYHCHLQPKEIWENKEFEDLGEMWLAGDHYKWRVMRTFGIDERLITGDASYYEKYLAFAKIFPDLIGNPVYIWCALELKRYFDIDDPLCQENAEEIYRKTKQLINEKHMTPQWCMAVSSVELVCTTEDPIDTLEYHQQLQKDASMTVKVLSAFRPDKAMFCERDTFNAYVEQLGIIANVKINCFSELMNALEKRLIFFKGIGTTISDNGIPDFTWENYTVEDIELIFNQAKAGNSLTPNEINQYRTAFLVEMGRRYHRNGFVMQLHVGTLLNANTSKIKILGESTGFDCIDDRSSVSSVGMLLDQLNMQEALPKTILYPLDGNKIESYAVLAAAFCEGGTRAKVQLGAPWWFNDQSFGIERQFAASANLYPISLSVGMVTDSRSFISYPRHELYRRLLCNYFGSLIERGEYFSSDEALKTIIENICYYNVKDFFGF